MLRVPFRFLEGCLIAAHGIQSQHVFVYIRGEYEREFEILRDSLEAMRKADLLGGVTVVIHRGAGAYICGEETALLESLEGKRGQPRTKPPFPAIAGLYAAPTAVNNVESITTVTPRPRDGRCGVREARRRELDRDARLLALRRRREPRQLRAAARDLDARADLRHRRRRPERPRAEGDHPRRLVDLGAHRRRHRREDGLHVARRGRLVDRLGRRHRHRRPLLHGAARHPRLAVLRARVVREVHAVPRRHEVGHADPPEDRGRPRRAGRPRPAPLGLRPDHGQVPLPARRLGRDRRPQLRRPLPRRVPGAHRPRTLPLRRRVVPRGDPRPGRPCTPTTDTRMSELVSVTVDDRNVAVPKGMGLVEAAQAAGIEIPVFCYEPRLGPPVGACRMCLVEIEGIPEAPGRHARSPSRRTW